MGSQHVIGEYQTQLTQQPNPRLGDSDLFSIHVLDGAQALPFLTLDDLLVVARAYTAIGSVVVVEYDNEWQRLTFYRQDGWLRGGRLAEDEDIDSPQERPSDASEP